MFDFLNLMAIVWVMLLWVTVGCAIYRWGPGTVRQRASCPERKQAAQLVVLQAEGDFGELRPADVMWCSLLGDEPVRCDRACLAHL